MNYRTEYAQVSTESRHLDLKRDVMLIVGCRVVYEDTVSGKSVETQ